MKLALIGYGIMGKLVEKHALARGHTIEVIFSSGSTNYEALAQVDMAIDFSSAKSVMRSVDKCIEYNKNLIIGTTGWEAEANEIEKKVQASSIGALYSPNFSIGVNLFFHLVEQAALLLKNHYEPAITEIHHKQKKDSPSGTALHLQKLFGNQEVPIGALRIGSAKGKHTILFDSPFDTISISHEAKARDDYAIGSLLAAEWLLGKQGFFTQFDGMKQIYHSLNVTK